MLIRSQDKRMIVILESVENLQVNTAGNIVARYPSESKMDIMGTYSSIDRAIEVLDDLQGAYQYIEECKAVGVENPEPRFVFQMPHDTEDAM